MRILSWFTLPRVVPSWTFFILLNTKEDVLKNVGIQTVDSSHWFSKCGEIPKVIGYQQQLCDTNILQHIFGLNKTGYFRCHHLAYRQLYVDFEINAERFILNHKTTESKPWEFLSLLLNGLSHFCFTAGHRELGVYRNITEILFWPQSCVSMF